MDARRSIESLLAKLRRGDEQETLHGTGLDARERQLLSRKVRAHIAERVVAAGIEDHELHARRLGRRHDALDKHALGDGAGGTVDPRIDGGKHIALLRCETMTGKEYEREIRSGRARLKLLQRIEKPVSVEVETTGRLVVAGDHVEAVLDEDLRHAMSVEDRIVQMW